MALPGAPVDINGVAADAAKQLQAGADLLSWHTAPPTDTTIAAQKALADIILKGFKVPREKTTEKEPIAQETGVSHAVFKIVEPEILAAEWKETSIQIEKMPMGTLDYIILSSSELKIDADNNRSLDALILPTVEGIMEGRVVMSDLAVPEDFLPKKEQIIRERAYILSHMITRTIEIKGEQAMNSGHAMILAVLFKYLGNLNLYPSDIFSEEQLKGIPKELRDASFLLGAFYLANKLEDSIKNGLLSSSDSVLDLITVIKLDMDELAGKNTPKAA